MKNFKKLTDRKYGAKYLKTLENEWETLNDEQKIQRLFFCIANETNTGIKKDLYVLLCNITECWYQSQLLLIK